LSRLRGTDDTQPEGYFDAGKNCSINQHTNPCIHDSSRVLPSQGTNGSRREGYHLLAQTLQLPSLRQRSVRARLIHCTIAIIGCMGVEFRRPLHIETAKLVKGSVRRRLFARVFPAEVLLPCYSQSACVGSVLAQPPVNKWFVPSKQVLLLMKTRLSSIVQYISFSAPGYFKLFYSVEHIFCGFLSCLVCRCSFLIGRQTHVNRSLAWDTKGRGGASCTVCVRAAASPSPRSSAGSSMSKIHSMKA